MTNPMIEAAAKAIALAEYDGHEIFLPLALHSKTAQARYLPRAQAAITAIDIPAQREDAARAERAAVVAWLDEHYDGELTSRIYLADAIDAGEHQPKENTDATSD